MKWAHINTQGIHGKHGIYSLDSLIGFGNVFIFLWESFTAFKEYVRDTWGLYGKHMGYVWISWDIHGIWMGT